MTFLHTAFGIVLLAVSSMLFAQTVPKKGAPSDAVKEHIPGGDHEMVKRPPTAVDPDAVNHPPKHVDPGMVETPPKIQQKNGSVVPPIAKPDGKGKQPAAK